MKNKILDILSKKSQYINKSDFYFDVYSAATKHYQQRNHKYKMLDTINGVKSVRFNRSIVYKRKRFFGLSYNSFVNHELNYQQMMINYLLKVVYSDPHISNNMTSLKRFHDALSSMKNSLEIIESHERHDIELNRY